MRARVLSFATVLFLLAACSGGDAGDAGFEGGIPDAGPDDTGTLDTGTPDTGTPDTGTPDTGTPDAGPDGAASKCDGGIVTLSSILPASGWSQAQVSVTISGGGFIATPTATLVPNMVPDGGAVTPLASIGFVSSSSLTARAPSGMAPGTYDLVVTNPDDCSVTLPAAYTVVANAPPKIISVQPGTGTTQKDVPVVITGCHFPNNATLTTIDVNAQTVAHSVQSVSCAGQNVAQCDNTPLCTMQATIQVQSKSLGAGAYVVRVTNPTDKTWGDWSAFVVTDPSGKLTGNWTQATSLVTGRRAFGALSGRLDDANRFLYVIGGEDKNGAALDTVEVAPLDPFGRLGKWFVQQNKLGAKRSGVAVGRQGRYLWALGGTSSTGGTGGVTPTGTSLASIERAMLLDPSGAPLVADPQASLQSGTLAKGTWYYKVAAVMINGDADNPGGETLASDEKIAVLSAQGQVALSWSAVQNAAFYRVYRSPVANGTSQSEVLVKDNVNATTYTDTGVDAPGSATPLAFGSTGVWKTMGTQLVSARLDATASIAPESSAQNAPLHLYVLGGWGKCPSMGSPGAMDCYEYATLSASGDTLGAFTTGGNKMQKARMRFGSTPVTSENGPTTYADGGAANTVSFVLVGGGNGISSTGLTVEYALVQSGGALGPFAYPGSGFALERDGSELNMVNGYAYAFQGGTPGMYRTSSDLSTNASVSQTTLTFGNWSNAGAAVPTGIGRHGVVLESAFFYAIGGTTNDTDALQTVYQIIY